MTEQDLRKLHRTELLELVQDLTKENQVLRVELDKLRNQLASRTIAIEKSGSLAEAAIRINGVFEACQAACEQYTMNLQQRVAEQERISQELEQRNQILEQLTREKCEQMLRETEMEQRIRKDKINEEINDCLSRAKEEAFALVNDAQMRADTIRREADAYRSEVDQAVKGIAESYSWLNKVLG